MQDITLLEEACEDQNNCRKYCVLKELIARDPHISRRLCMQITLIDKFKFVRSKEKDKDLGWNKSMQLWVEEGWAKQFAEIYTDKITLRECWKQLGIQ
jgi:hypothetical protein